MSTFEIPEIPVRRLVSWTLGVMAVVGFFALLIRFDHIVLLILAAIILSAVIRPPVAWLARHGVPRIAGILAVFIAFGLLIGLFVWLTVPVLIEQGTALGLSLGNSYQQLYEFLSRLPNVLVRRMIVLLPTELPQLTPPTPVAPADVEGDLSLGANLAQLQGILGALFQLVAAVLLTFYWALEGEQIKQSALLLVPSGKRSEIRDLVTQIETGNGSYLIGQGVLCLSIGSLALVAYLLIGLPHALLLAVIAGIMEAVPMIGPVLGAVPAVIVALTVSPTAALWVVLASVVIQVLENNLLVPRIMNKAIGVRPLVTILALLAFSSLFGLIGALIALPLAAIIQALLDYFMRARDKPDERGPSRDRLSVLRYNTSELIQDVRGQVRRKESEASSVSDTLEDQIEMIAIDLEAFLTTVEKAGKVQP